MQLTSKVRGWAADRVVRELDRRDRVLARPRFHEENSIDLRALLARSIEREKAPFVVLQIGANDGVALDPIRDSVLAQGWTLYAVEPMPGVFERLKANYGPGPQFHYINCAVGDHDGEADIYYLEQPEAVDGPDYDQYTSFSREVIERHWRAIPDAKQRVAIVSVPVRRLDTLIREFDVPEVDLLQIDTEGFDYEIIKMAFAAGLAPPLLAFEWTHLSRDDMWSCRTDLIERGYRWLINKGDVIAAREDVLGG
jgi:FkbM family methyltransferase